jgi:hypothetical protein
MEQFLPLIIQLIAGAVGGNAAGAAAKNVSLGGLGNTIAGAVGGGALGQLLPIILPMLMKAGAGGGMDLGAIATDLVGGGVGGAVLTAIIGFVKNKMATK